MARKDNPVRYSSAIGEAWLHLMIKIKYCHPIFDMKEIREECDKLLDEASERYGIIIDGKGFDSNHIHMKVDIGNYSRSEVAKMLKGYVARKLFTKFPWLKKKYFWKSGLWNPSYYFGSAHDLGNLAKYLRKQRWFDPNQTRLINF